MALNGGAKSLKLRSNRQAPSAATSPHLATSTMWCATAAAAAESGEGKGNHHCCTLPPPSRGRRFRHVDNVSHFHEIPSFCVNCSTMSMRVGKACQMIAMNVRLWLIHLARTCGRLQIICRTVTLLCQNDTKVSKYRVGTCLESDGNYVIMVAHFLRGIDILRGRLA